MIDPLDDEALHAAIAAWRATITPSFPTGNLTHAGQALGISRNALTNRLFRAAQRGMIPIDETTPGWVVSRMSVQRDSTGKVKATSATIKPENGGPFKVDKGHVVKGVSALVDQHGNVVQQWVKTGANIAPENQAELIKRAFEGWKPQTPHVIRPVADEDCINTFIACDWHVGMHAHGAETGAGNYDLKIARQSITESFAELVSEAPKAGQAIFLGLGDLQHADNVKGMTEGHGHVLDMDSRYSKMTETTCDIVLDCLNMVRGHHARTHACFLPGNHDETFTAGLRWAMWALFRDDELTTVDRFPGYLWAKRYGVNLIGGAHGDKAKREKLPFMLTTQYKQEWAQAKCADLHTGHIHHDTLKEENGIRVFSHRAPIPPDAHHASQGYNAGKAVKLYKYHMTKGTRGNNEVVIG